MQPHRRQPTRLPGPWDSPGKNTGVGCHFLLQCMKVKSQSEVAQLCPTLSDPMDCNLPGSSIHEIFQARVLEWGAIACRRLEALVNQQVRDRSCARASTWVLLARVPLPPWQHMIQGEAASCPENLWDFKCFPELYIILCKTILYLREGQKEKNNLTKCFPSAYSS